MAGGSKRKSKKPRPSGAGGQQRQPMTESKTEEAIEIESTAIPMNQDDLIGQQETEASTKDYDDLELDLEIAMALLDLKGAPKPVINSLGKDQQRPPPQGAEGDPSQKFPTLDQAQFFGGTELPTLPASKNLRDIIGSCSKSFVKQLTNADVNNEPNGLYFHKDITKETILPLLKELEVENLDAGEGIAVTVYDSKDNPYDMVFKTWIDSGSNIFYVLTVGWARFCDQHKLKAVQDWVTVWAFRHKHNGNLCFLLTCRRP
ncbi:hypothetical protein M9H77_22109 [Catharanthus roseus]|uniref:Uncharacterized protein n=1 Tax=Catharanthus roseus TaxID=4058 RepID=A0ACC0APY1_CATRO|nr:hypothetical protein M9H77_22109 [Catharanthus roseus]